MNPGAPEDAHMCVFVQHRQHALGQPGRFIALVSILDLDAGVNESTQA